MSAAQWLLLGCLIFGMIVLLLKPMQGPQVLLIGILGYAWPGLNSVTDFGRGRSPISEVTVAIYAVVILLTCFLCLVIPSQKAPDQAEEPDVKKRILPFSVFLGFACGLMLMYLMARYGPLFFAIARDETPLNGYEQVVYRTLASLTFVVGIIDRRLFPIIASAVMLAIYTIMGDRTALAMAIVAWFIQSSYTQGIPFWRILAKNWILVASGVVFAVYGKMIYSFLNALIGGRLTPEAIELILNSPSRSRPESVGIFQLLNQVVINDWRLEPDSLQGTLLSPIPLSTMLGARSDNFNKYMQAELFPAARPFSLAYNPWAEGWAMAGWLGVLVVWMMLAGSALALHHLAGGKTGWIRGAVAISLAYVGAYSQRNTLLTLTAFMVQLLLGILLLYGAFKLSEKIATIVKERFWGVEDAFPDGAAP